MAEELKRALNIEPILVKGEGGIFEVKVDGEVLFSRKTLGSFPQPEEVVAKIAERIKNRG